MAETRTVLITGATSGIGRVTALHLAARGFRVLASGRREEALASLANESKGAIDGVPMDVTRPASVAAARDEIERRTDGHGLDALVNNAGYGQGGPIEMVTDDELRAQYETNVFGLVRVTRAFLPRMRERRGGRVVNVGSVAGHVALPFLGVYASTKHALEGISDALRLELRPFGVHVVLIKPGAIRTDFGEIEKEGLRKHAGPGGPYAPLLEPFMRWHATFHPTAPGPEHVARAIERALTDDPPRDRYHAPPRNAWVMRLRTMLPTRASDAIINRLAGLGGVRP
jgi:NAD(P)-dependent dehydrogenase (short-subunit alcohol dehydrogenase family)